MHQLAASTKPLYKDLSNLGFSLSLYNNVGSLTKSPKLRKTIIIVIQWS